MNIYTFGLLLYLIEKKNGTKEGLGATDCGVDGVVADPVLSGLYFAAYAGFVPVCAIVFGVCVDGDSAIWAAEGGLVGDSADLSVSSLGGGGV